VPWFPNDRFRLLIEQVVSSHRGQAWTVRTISVLDEFAPHPAAILTGDGFAVFAKVSTAANGSEQFEIELAGLRLLTDLSGVRTPHPIGSGDEYVP
jgi:hypothetical protein